MAEKKNKGGRPSKLTPEVHEEAVRLAGTGVFFCTIAQALGIGETTFYRWLETGEADHTEGRDTDHARFWKAIKNAEASAEINCLRDVVLGRPQWQARAWFLERKYKDRWAQRPAQQIELTGKNGGPIEVSAVRDRLMAALTGAVEGDAG